MIKLYNLAHHHLLLLFYFVKWLYVQVFGSWMSWFLDYRSRLTHTHRPGCGRRGWWGPRQHWVSSRKETIRALEENTSTPQRRLHRPLLPSTPAPPPSIFPLHLKGAPLRMPAHPSLTDQVSAAQTQRCGSDANRSFLVEAKTCKTVWGIFKNNRLTESDIVPAKTGRHHTLSLIHTHTHTQIHPCTKTSDFTSFITADLSRIVIHIL